MTTKNEMTKKVVMDIVKQWKEKTKVRMMTPYIYFENLPTKKLIIQKLEEMKRNRYEKDVSKIKFPSDEAVTKTKRSSYHGVFENRFHISSHASLKEKSKVTGVPVSILNEVYKKGLGAYKSGHRPGANLYSWANARVNSFLTLGCAAFSSDSYLLKKVYDMKYSKKRHYFFTQKITCPKQKRIQYQKKFSASFLEKNNKYKKKDLNK